MMMMTIIIIVFSKIPLTNTIQYKTNQILNQMTINTRHNIAKSRPKSICNDRLQFGRNNDDDVDDDEEEDDWLQTDFDV